MLATIQLVNGGAKAQMQVYMSLVQGSANFFWKGLDSKYTLGFAGHTISVATTQLCIIAGNNK